MSKALVIAGGGTGGHVLAGVAIAEAWMKRLGAEGKVYYIGARGGLEERLVPPQGIPLVVLRLGALNRVSRVQKFKTFCQLPFAFLKSFFWLLKWKPNFVVGVGGYSSGPVLMSAWILSKTRLLSVEVAVLEQNSVLGLTNRILAGKASRLFLAFPPDQRLGTPDLEQKARVVGNPIRSTMRRLPAGKFNPFTLFVFGGSRGAVGMNSMVMEALPLLMKEAPELRVIHQTGEVDFSRIQEAYKRAGFPESQVQVHPFITNMLECYEKASLVICRAGSSTLAEIAAVGRAAIFVPLPTAADNHQEKNAQVFCQAGAARSIRQGSEGGSALALLILELLKNPSQISDMEMKVTQFYRPHAAEEVVNGLLNPPEADR